MGGRIDIQKSLNRGCDAGHGQRTQCYVFCRRTARREHQVAL